MLSFPLPSPPRKLFTKMLLERDLKVLFLLGSVFFGAPVLVLTDGLGTRAAAALEEDKGFEAALSIV